MPITWRDCSDDDYQPTSAEESRLSEKWARDDQWEAYREDMEREFPKTSQEGDEDVTTFRVIEHRYYTVTVSGPKDRAWNDVYAAWNDDDIMGLPDWCRDDGVWCRWNLDDVTLENITPDMYSSKVRKIS